MAIFSLLNFLILILLTLVFESFSILIIGTLGYALLRYFLKITKINHSFILSLVYIIVIILLLIIYFGYENLYGLPYFSGGSDDLIFEQTSRYILEQGYRLPRDYLADLNLRYNNSKGFLWILSWIMKIVEPFGGYHTISFRVLNIYFMIGTGILTTSIFKKHYEVNTRQEVLFLCFTTLFPNIIYLSVHVFRDTLITLFLVYILYIWDDFLNWTNKTNKDVVLLAINTIIITYISYLVRSQSLIFIIIIIFILIFLNNRVLKLKNFIYFLIVLILILVIAEYSNVLETVLSFNERYSQHKLSMDARLSRIVFSQSLFPIGIVLRLIYGLLYPIPIPVLNTFSMFSNVDIFFNVLVSYGTIIQIYLIPYLFKNYKFIDKFFIIYLMFLLGIVTTTFTFRHFIMLYPYMFILIFRQFFKSTNKDKLINFIVVSFVLVFGLSIYVFLI